MNERHEGLKMETAMNRGRLLTRAIALMIGIGLFLGGCAGSAYDGYVGDPPLVTISSRARPGREKRAEYGLLLIFTS